MKIDDSYEIGSKYTVIWTQVVKSQYRYTRAGLHEYLDSSMSGTPPETNTDKGHKPFPRIIIIRVFCLRTGLSL